MATLECKTGRDIYREMALAGDEPHLQTLQNEEWIPKRQLANLINTRINELSAQKHVEERALPQGKHQTSKYTYLLGGMQALEKLLETLQAKP